MSITKKHAIVIDLKFKYNYSQFSIIRLLFQNTFIMLMTTVRMFLMNGIHISQKFNNRQQQLMNMQGGLGLTKMLFDCDILEWQVCIPIVYDNTIVPNFFKQSINYQSRFL